MGCILMKLSDLQGFEEYSFDRAVGCWTIAGTE